MNQKKIVNNISTQNKNGYRASLINLLMLLQYYRSNVPLPIRDEHGPGGPRAGPGRA